MALRNDARPLVGKNVLVTGASRGIGRATALAFADAGAALGLTARGADELGEVASEVEARGARASVVVCDVTVASDVERMVAQMRSRLGGLDVVVNNAGSGASHKIVGHPDELWRRMIELNLTSVYLVTKAVVPVLIERGGGRIVNVASTAAKIGARYVAAYTAAKHGVLGLTRALAAELAAERITVNAICPGYVDTPMTEATIAAIVARTGRDAAAARRSLEATSPQNRLIAAEEIAAVAVFLAGDAAAGINGQAIVVDGGAVTC